MNQNDNKQKQRNEWNNPTDATILKLRTINTIATVSIIAAPVSLLFGGFILSGGALICAIVALVKLTRITKTADEAYSGYTKVMHTRVIASLIASMIAFVLNMYSFITVLPVVTEMLQGGSIEETVSSLQDAATESSNGQSGNTENTDPRNPGKDSVFG